jgi:ABC-type dipeptide/oligopeptide/nickel transport system permease component
MTTYSMPDFWIGMIFIGLFAGTGLYRQSGANRQERDP